MRSVLKQFRNDPLYGLSTATAAAGMVSIGACHTLLGVSLGVLLVQRARFRMVPFWPAIAFFMAATLLSGAVNGHFAEGWPQYRKFYVWAILPVVYSGLRTAWQARQTLVAMAVGGTASAAWGLVQFYRKYERAAELGQPFYQSYVGSRITGFTSHWQTFAGGMMLAFLIVAAFLLVLRQEARAVAGVSLCLLALALLLGFTRSIWPATAAGLIVLLWHWRPVAVLSLPVLAGVIVVAAPEPLHSRIVSLWKPNATLDSNEHRAVLRRTGLAMTAEHPLFGVGPERVLARFEQYYPADAPHPVPTEWYTSHLHNTYIHYAAERGVPAMLALLTFILLSWGRILSALRHVAVGDRDRRFVLLVAAAVVPGILVSGWWEVNLGDSEVLGCFLAILACGFVGAADEPFV
jgi:O-antigen ligase